LAQVDQVEKRSYYQDEELIPRERKVDFEKLKLEVSFVPEEGLVKGKVTHTFKVLRKDMRELFLDGIKMKYQSVKLNGEVIKYNESDKGISLFFNEYPEWNSEHTLTIEYEAHPLRGLYFIGWDDSTGTSRKQIWTQGQGINNRHWIPMYDEKNDKVISETIIDFEEGYEVLSNGELLKKKKVGDKLRWHYKISEPHPTYLIMIGIGKYAIKETKSASGVPMQFYYYPDQAEQLEPTYRYSVEMFDFFEKEIGVPYPWKNYSQIPVQNFMYGAMENTTSTIFGDFYLVDERAYLDRNYVRVNAHELAHQWFGDLVTARSSAHHWLQESFATHYDMMYQKEAFGQDHFDWVRYGYNNQALGASKQDIRPIAHSEAGSTRHYPKGAFVLEMLKYVTGRPEYNAAVKHYLEKHAYGNVDSEDLLVAFHEKLGMSLDWFWEEWVYRGGEPHFQVEFNADGESANFYVQQVHPINELRGYFKMPIDFLIAYKNGTIDRKQIMVEGASEYVSFEQKGEIDYYLFDPNWQVMKELTFNKPLGVLKAQAEKAQYMLDRYLAIEKLVEMDFEGKNEFLLERFKAEDFHAIKSKIISYIVPQLNESTEELVELAAADADAEVRKALLESTYRIPASLEDDYRKLLKDDSYKNIELALDLLCFYYPMNKSVYLEMTDDVTGARDHNLRTKWLKWSYLRTQDESYLSELVEMTSNKYEFLTRINAAESLKDLNYLNERALSYMLEGTFSFNSRLVRPMSEILDYYFDQIEYRAMMVQYVSSRNWSDREFRKVKEYLIP
jgi:aminopeptidase N